MSRGRPSLHWRAATFNGIIHAAFAAGTLAAMTASGSSPRVNIVPGDHIGPYVILRRLGHGGMGQVFLADDSRLHRKVALKQVFGDSDPEATIRSSVLREAEAVARVSHPNVAIVHDVIENAGAAFIVMEYVEGETLEARLARERLPISVVVQFGRQLAAALAVAHSKGIIHRDLKPSNIQVTPQNTVKILDFGVAKVIELLSTVTTTELGALQTAGVHTTPRGTPGYMAPEQMLGRPVGPSTDLFSLGVVLFEMSTGRRLFQCNDTGQILAAMTKPLPRPADLDANVPANLSSLITELIEIDVRKRATSAGDVELRLAALQTAAPVAQTLSTGTSVATVQELRGRLILAQGHSEMVRLKYELEQYLADRPHDVDGRLLKDDVDRALSMGFGTGGVRARMAPPQASRSSRVWSIAGIVVAVVFTGSLLFFRGRAHVPKVVEGPIPPLTTSTVPATATLPTSTIPVTPAAEDEFQRHFKRAETLIAEGNKTGASAENASALAVLPKDSRALSQLKKIAAMPERMRAGAPAPPERQPVPGLPTPKPAVPPSPQPGSSSTGSGTAAPPGAASGTPSPPTMTPSAPPATNPTPVPQLTSEEAAVMATLREYAAAQESLSVDAVRRVYPTINAETLARSFRALSSQHVEIVGGAQITIDGTNAIVRCQVRLAFTPKVGQGRTETQTAVFRLQKTGDRWIIVERR
jgi:serine/threonine protein kinase